MKNTHAGHLDNSLSQLVQHLPGVSFGFDVGIDFQDVSVLVNHEGGADHPFGFFAVYRFFSPRTVQPVNFGAGIGQQRELEAEALRPFFVCLRVVAAYADYYGVFLFESSLRVTKLGRFAGSPAGVGFRVEKQDKFLTREIRQGTDGPALIGQGKIGGFVGILDSHWISSLYAYLNSATAFRILSTPFSISPIERAYDRRMFSGAPNGSPGTTATRAVSKRNAVAS